jgi:hypothetical protein
VRERQKVRDRPLISVRAAGARQIFEEVKVKTQQREPGRLPAADSQEESDEGDDQAEPEVVAGDVVILRPPQ